jgi:hypothetical protein
MVAWQVSQHVGLTNIGLAAVRLTDRVPASEEPATSPARRLVGTAQHYTQDSYNSYERRSTALAGAYERWGAGQEQRVPDPVQRSNSIAITGWTRSAC